eukprot:m.295016 g.295016  ORF g.295016 m.295016 type:complete len:659 (-) comp19510_c0_seq5:122-2098(-)
MGDSEDEGDPGQPLLAGHVNRSTTASPVPAAATAAATSAPSATTISDKRGLHHIQEGQGHNGDDWDQHHARDRAGECTWLHCVGIECSRRTAVKVGVLAGALAGVVAVITLFVPQLIHGHNVHSWPHWANAACDVYCKGDLLDTAQRRNVFPNDSKYFVDMPMYDNPQTVLTDFDNLGDGDLEGFIQRHFADPGSDLDRIDPPDFDAEGPWWLTTLNSTTHSWAKGVHKIWRELTRKVTDAVQARPERHSLLWVPNNIVVPGGRFREAYYWDSYWIVRGLVSSGMNTTAEGVVRNFGHLIDTFGFVPNGGRVYYLTRSQPPFLSEMVRFLYEELKDVRFLKEMLPKLDREYRYWMQQGDTGHAVRVVLDGTSHVLNRFVADTSDPRPESYREDIATARDEKDPDHVYQELASGAETGWDFSSRWLLDVDVLGSIRTSRLAPADLNAVMYRFERNLEFLHTKAGSSRSTIRQYSVNASARATAIETLLFNHTTAQWHDLHIPSKTQVTDHNASASNFIPLWAGLPQHKDAIDAVVRAFEHSGLLQAGGVLTTASTTGQQWDSPNAWPPVQWLLAAGLQTAGTKEALALADVIKCRWLNTMQLAWNKEKDGIMYEKYNAFEPGTGGGGGEYVPQTGFGWTNGVALEWLRLFGTTYEKGCT